MANSSSGRCLCGSVQFTAEDVETHHHACHCTMCRRWAGGPFFGARAEKVDFQADKTLARYASSSWAERGFCNNCGTVLFYFLKPTSTYMMSVGSFDDQTPFRLVREIFVDRKPDGYSLVGDHPRLTEAETFAAMAPPEPPAS